MRQLVSNNHADLDMIIGAVVVAITLAISIIVVWNVVGSVDTTSLDTAVRTATGGTAGQTDATNATDDLSTNLQTFYTVGPIVLIVMAAVGILGYVLLLRRQ